MEQSFRDFIRDLLKRGQIKDSLIDEFTNEANMRKFRAAFTHATYNAKENYELYEYFGDPIVNEFLPFYIYHRFSFIRSVLWLTKIKHYLAGKKFLAQVARSQGFERFALYGDEIKFFKENPGKDKDRKYISMLEDTIEAFCGCLVEIITTRGEAHGAATEVCRNVLRTFCDNEDLPIKYEDVFDAVSRLKELYETKISGLRWQGQDKIYKNKKLPDGKIHVDVYGWPLGNKEQKDENKVLLASASDINKKVAKEIASSRALTVLDNTYNIRNIPPPFD